MTDTTEQASNFVRELGAAAARNPVSAALIGMGVVWMFRSQLVKSGDVDAQSAGRARASAPPASSLGSSSATAIKDTLGSVRDTLGSAKDNIQEKVGTILEDTAAIGRGQADTLAGYAQTVPQAGADMLTEIRSSISELFQTQPLALGAIGLAIGAGIAGALPRTQLDGISG
jgi:hypothetical protein